MSDPNLGEFALGVGGKIDGNPLFAGFKVTGAQLVIKATEFNTAVASCVGGDSTDTAHKKAVRAALIAMMNTIANEVEDLAQGNVEILTASGFHLTNPNAPSPAPVGSVAIQNITNVATTKLELDLAVTGNVWTVVVESMTAPNVWMKVAVFTDLNNTVVPNLQPGTVYTFRVCAMAAGNQQSEWSAPLSAMST